MEAGGVTSYPAPHGRAEHSGCCQSRGPPPTPSFTASHEQNSTFRTMLGQQPRPCPATGPPSQVCGLPVTPAPGTFKLVENAVVLIEGTELAPKVIVDLVREDAG